MSFVGSIQERCRMDVTIAKFAGACFGVERALDIVSKYAEERDNVVTLGPLIHNPKVVADLDAKGVCVVDKPEDVEESTLIIRTHGVVPEVIERAKSLGHDVIDATCPYVKKVHLAASRLVDEGYQVIIVGESGHPEVEGIIGHAQGAWVIGSIKDLENKRLPKKIGVVVQTTQSGKLLQEIVSYLCLRCENLKVINTICQATSERQSAAKQLAEKCDCMIVIGGKNSANTTRLYEICLQACPNTHHIETSEELRVEWFRGCKHVGITAGASTPQKHIKIVKSAIDSLIANMSQFK